MALTVVSIWFIVSTFREWNSEHGRLPGQADISFDIAPDGNSILFNANGEGGRDLYILDLITKRVTRIAKTPAYEVAPRFSPDGKWLVYAAGNPGDRADHLYLRSVDGKTVKQLTNVDAKDNSPSFSPDGKQIVFNRDTTYDASRKEFRWGPEHLICVINADGTGFRQLTLDRSSDAVPRFSPDGKQIEIGARAPVHADGSATSRPLVAAKRVRSGCYSPDGRFVVFTDGTYASDAGLYIENTDGTGRRRLDGFLSAGRDTVDFSHAPAFKPDGKSIMFLVTHWSDRVPMQSLWEISLNGEKSQRIGDSYFFDNPLHWNSASR